MKPNNSRNKGECQNKIIEIPDSYSSKELVNIIIKLRRCQEKEVVLKVDKRMVGIAREIMRRLGVSGSVVKMSEQDLGIKGWAGFRD